MRAMLLEQAGDIDSEPLVLREVEDPVPGPRELRVKVSVCAVCRTDLHIVEGELPPKRRPIIPGHQIVGVVDQLGEGCQHFRVGDRVGVAWLRHVDGTCRFCERGWENLCPESRYTGYHEHGGYAEFAVAPEDFVYALPERYDDVAVSPLLCAGLIGYRALERASVPPPPPPEAKLLLVGFGSSAHIVAQLALHRGHEVYVLSRTPSHRKMALDLGATWAGDDANKLPAKMDSAILFAPTGKLVPPVLEALDRGGTLSIAGIHLSDVPELTYEKHLFYEKQVRSVTANTREDARRLLDEAVAAGVTPMTTIYPLEDANRALADMKHSRTGGTGVLVMGA